MRLLVVEDDKDLNRQIVSALEQAGYAVDRAFDGEDGGYLGETEPYDAIVLDLGLPMVDGVTVLQQWRRAGKTMPVLILTARDRWSDKVAAFDAGADDYVVKPFNFDELLARVRALLRRGQRTSTQEELRFADLTLNPGSREVHRGNRRVDLTAREFEMLTLFMQNPRQVLTRSIIFERVWGYDFGPTSNSLDVYIGYLRRKTEDAGAPRIIHTVRGVGYALRES